MTSYLGRGRSKEELRAHAIEVQRTQASVHEAIEAEVPQISIWPLTLAERKSKWQSRWPDCDGFYPGSIKADLDLAEGGNPRTPRSVRELLGCECPPETATPQAVISKRAGKQPKRKASSQQAGRASKRPTPNQKVTPSQMVVSSTSSAAALIPAVASFTPAMTGNFETSSAFPQQMEANLSSSGAISGRLIPVCEDLYPEPHPGSRNFWDLNDEDWLSKASPQRPLDGGNSFIQPGTYVPAPTFINGDGHIANNYSFSSGPAQQQPTWDADAFFGMGELSAANNGNFVGPSYFSGQQQPMTVSPGDLELSWFVPYGDTSCMAPQVTEGPSFTPSLLPQEASFQEPIIQAAPSPVESIPEIGFTQSTISPVQQVTPILSSGEMTSQNDSEEEESSLEAWILSHILPEIQGSS
jgi:hypothetical protein